MSAAATVRAISAPVGLLGPHYYDADCRLPVGSCVVELKACENCGKSFLRNAKPLRAITMKLRYEWQPTPIETTVYQDTGRRICRDCELMPLREAARLEEYKAAMPGTEAQMHHALHLPKYDKTLLPEPPTASRKKVGRPKSTGLSFGEIEICKLCGLEAA